MPSLSILSNAHLSARSNTPAATLLTPDSDARFAADRAVSEAACPASWLAATWPPLAVPAPAAAALLAAKPMPSTEIHLTLPTTKA
jgi:hypothetical protein